MDHWREIRFLSQYFPFTRALPTRRGKLAGNACLWLSARDEQGATHWAEVAALPGIHRFALEQVRRELTELLLERPCGRLCWTKPAFGLIRAEGASIQALFALEGLLLGRYRQQFLQDFGLAEHFSVPLNGFIPGPDSKAMLGQARKLVEDGFGSLKIKLGVAGEREEEELLRELVGLGVGLRLDANGRLTPKRLVRLLAAIGPAGRDRIEYIEEPYAELSRDLGVFADFPLALDESLNDSELPSSPAALVVKPGRHLALSGTLRLLASFPKVIISSAYESPLGLWALAHLAALSGRHCGLDVQKYFRPHPATPFHPSRGGRLFIGGDYQKELAERAANFRNMAGAAGFEPATY